MKSGIKPSYDPSKETLTEFAIGSRVPNSRRKWLKSLLMVPFVPIAVGGAMSSRGKLKMNRLDPARVDQPQVVDYKARMKSRPMFVSLMSVWLIERVNIMQKASICGDEDNVIDNLFSILALTLLLIGACLQGAARDCSAQWLLAHTKDFNRIPFWMRLVPTFFTEFTYTDQDNDDAMNAVESKFYNGSSLLDRESIH